MGSKTTFLDPIDFQCMDNKKKNLKNIFFCVPQNKESHTGLEQHGGEKIMTEVITLLNYFIKEIY